MKNKKWIGYLAAVFISLCIVCLVAIIAIETSDTVKRTDYMSEFGGSPEVYARIQSLSDCAALQSEFDQAEQNLSLQEPGTQQYRWGLGYMKASDDRMKEISCYESQQISIEQMIVMTSAAAQTQTMAVASPMPTFTPFVYTTPSYTIQSTLVPTWTPIPTNTLFVLTLVTVPASDAGGQCVCSEDLYNCGDPLEQVCFNACNAQGAGDIHRLDQNNNGIACEDY